jgi:hypothetical protein
MATKKKESAARPPRKTGAKSSARRPGTAGAKKRSIGQKTRGPAAAARKRSAAKPALLSGGNPQIAKADGAAPVDAYIAAMPGWKRDVGRRLDALVERNVPGVRKAVRWNSPFYGTEENGWFLSFHCITRYVKVAFFRGTSLRPLPPIPSKNEGTRYYHVHEGEEIDDKLVGSWIRQAAELPGWDGFTC